MNYIVPYSLRHSEMDNSMQDNSSYSEGASHTYGLKPQDRYTLNNASTTSGFSTSPSSRSSFEMSTTGNSRQPLIPQVNITYLMPEITKYPLHALPTAHNHLIKSIV